MIVSFLVNLAMLCGGQSNGGALQCVSRVRRPTFVFFQRYRAFRLPSSVFRSRATCLSTLPIIRIQYWQRLHFCLRGDDPARLVLQNGSPVSLFICYQSLSNKLCSQFICIVKLNESLIRFGLYGNTHPCNFLSPVHCSVTSIHLSIIN